MSDEAFSRTEMLFGAAALERLSAARVAIFGLGGVGGHVLEALARSGIGAFDLVDSDTVALSNLNRQLLATRSTLGLPKVEAAARRVRDINPACALTLRQTFYLPETEGDFDFTQYDYVVDCIDTMSAKMSLITACHAAQTPILCAMGAGNKLDPTAFRVADLADTRFDPVARVLRKELRKRGIVHVKVVYSEEPPLTPAEAPAEERGARRSLPGSNSFVPAAMGLILAGEVVKDLTGIRGNPLEGVKTP